MASDRNSNFQNSSQNQNQNHAEYEAKLKALPLPPHLKERVDAVAREMIRTPAGGLAPMYHDTMDRYNAIYADGMAYKKQQLQKQEAQEQQRLQLQLLLQKQEAEKRDLEKKHRQEFLEAEQSASPRTARAGPVVTSPPATFHPAAPAAPNAGYDSLAAVMARMSLVPVDIASVAPGPSASPAETASGPIVPAPSASQYRLTAAGSTVPAPSASLPVTAAGPTPAEASAAAAAAAAVTARKSWVKFPMDNAAQYNLPLSAPNPRGMGASVHAPEPTTGTKPTTTGKKHEPVKVNMYVGDLQHLKKDHQGNEYLGKSNWGNHPGTKASANVQKQFNEKHGCFIICRNCIAYGEPCSHGWPCTFCEKYELKCELAIDKMSIGFCKYGIKCQELHPETIEYLVQKYGCTEKQLWNARWSFPGDTRMLGNSGKDKWGNPKINRFKLPEKGILWPYHPENNLCGFDPVLGKEPWVRETFPEPLESREDRLEREQKEQQQRQVANLTPPLPIVTANVPGLRRVPSEFEIFGYAEDDLDRFETDFPNEYAKALSLQRHVYHTGASSEDAPMPARNREPTGLQIGHVTHKFTGAKKGVEHIECEGATR